MRIVLICVIVATFLTGIGSAPAADRPTIRIAIALDGLPWSGGVVGDGTVSLAVGFDAEVARVVARRLGLRPVFVRVPRARLGKPGAWDLAVGSRAGSSVLSGDHIVVLAPGVTRPRSLPELRTRVLCARRGTRGADALVSLRTVSRVLAGSQVELARLIRTGRCDAALADAGDATRLTGRPVARLQSALGYGVLASRASGLGDDVEREVRALARSGTLGRLARAWLGVDPARLPRLR